MSRERVGTESLPPWVSLVLVTACIAGYFPILSSGFHADDFQIYHAVRNFKLAEVGSVGIFFRPLVWISFKLDSFMFGGWEMGYHLENVLLHAVAVIGVAMIAMRLFRNRWPALVAGLIFALHPAHPEAVTWVAGRFDVMCGALLAWSLYFHLIGREPSQPGARRLRSCSIILFLFACLAKEVAYVFPLVILLTEIYPLAENDGRPVKFAGIFRRVMPYFISLTAVLIARVVILHGFGGGPYIPREDGFHFWTFIYQLFIQPFKLLLLPVNRLLFSPLGVAWNVVMTGLLLSPLLLFKDARSRGGMIVLAAAVVICSIPTAHMGMLEDCLRNTRFLYTPSIFFSLIIAKCIVPVGRAVGKFRLRSLVAVFYIAMLFLCLLQNNSAWTEAGHIVDSVKASSTELVEQFNGEWGVKRKRLLVFNAPQTYLGALVFDWGLPEMLLDRFGDELGGVSVEVIHGGIQTRETIEKLREASRDDTVVWVYMDDARTLAAEGMKQTYPCN